MPGMLDRLSDSNNLLEEINKGLNAYLEKKRLFFSRCCYLISYWFLHILAWLRYLGMSISMGMATMYFNSVIFTYACHSNHLYGFFILSYLFAAAWIFMLVFDSLLDFFSFQTTKCLKYCPRPKILIVFNHIWRNVLKEWQNCSSQIT